METFEIFWKGERTFEANPPEGIGLTFDAIPEAGGTGNGPTPMTAMLSAVAACSGIDVISILEKKRQKVSSYRIRMVVERATGDYPKPYTKIVLHHDVQGELIDEAAVRQAIQLSDEKYCTAIATLRFAPEVQSLIEIKTPEPTA